VRKFKDLAARRMMLVLTFIPGFIVLLMLFGLFGKARPILAVKPIASLLFSSVWSPLKGQFGLWPFIMGTLWVTFVALILAAPVSLFTAVYLSEYAPRWIREFMKPIIDLLAGIPSVVYGVWGLLLIVPLVSKVLAPLFGVYSSGYSILAAGIVLAIMIFPTIIHVSIEVFASISYQVREASYSLGATKYETVRHVVLRKGAQGFLASVVLGLSRAFGETMAVLMVVGNIPKAPKSVFDGAATLPTLIANNYGEMMTIPQYDSALMLSALVLLLVVLFFNVLARFILTRVERRAE